MRTRTSLAGSVNCLEIENLAFVFTVGRGWRHYDLGSQGRILLPDEAIGRRTMVLPTNDPSGLDL